MDSVSDQNLAQTLMALSKSSSMYSSNGSASELHSNLPVESLSSSPVHSPTVETHPHRNLSCLLLSAEIASKNEEVSGFQAKEKIKALAEFNAQNVVAGEEDDQHSDDDEIIEDVESPLDEEGSQSPPSINIMETSAYESSPHKNKRKTGAPHRSPRCNHLQSPPGIIFQFQSSSPFKNEALNIILHPDLEHHRYKSPQPHLASPNRVQNPRSVSSRVTKAKILTQAQPKVARSERRVNKENTLPVARRLVEKFDVSENDSEDTRSEPLAGSPDHTLPKKGRRGRPPASLKAARPEVVKAETPAHQSESSTNAVDDQTQETKDGQAFPFYFLSENPRKAKLSAHTALSHTPKQAKGIERPKRQPSDESQKEKDHDVQRAVRGKGKEKEQPTKRIKTEAEKEEVAEEEENPHHHKEESEVQGESDEEMEEEDEEMDKEPQSSVSKKSEPGSHLEKPEKRKSRGLGRNSPLIKQVCASCGTSDTPYWRDGWHTVTLCNACGIRYQKYRMKCLNCIYIPRKDETGNTRCNRCGHPMTTK